ncbi:MAG TPA: glycine dehydrogenase (aminomethyl-transferring), partial [Planctomycetaceae bacterium]|nr:glycine dehydrogenase (aminomethyl-transferring) [Planctomycetaceae bacterium]
MSATNGDANHKKSVSQSPFVSRHIGPRDSDIAQMLARLGYTSLDELTQAVVPPSIVNTSPMDLPDGVDESVALAELKQLASQNQSLHSFIGCGYYGTNTPAVIRRSVLENPAWYTAYTPYQPEISQGRLELLFYFQTMVCELTGMDICGASLLDEATAAAEAMALCLRSPNGKGHRFLISSNCHPQTIQVVQTRAVPPGIEVVLWDETEVVSDWSSVLGVLVQYPGSDGAVWDCQTLLDQAHRHGALTVVATDLLALSLLKPPGSLGADMVVGSAQRFGVPMGFGGPHAAFLATRDAFKRLLPGRLVGKSIDVHGAPAYRLALQTREQHIRREKATSNICTAQALLAMMSTLYAMYHGPEGLSALARRINSQACRLAASIQQAGFRLRHSQFFDTLAILTGDSTESVMSAAVSAGYNLRRIDDATVGISLDETTEDSDLDALASIFGASKVPSHAKPSVATEMIRSDNFLSQSVFHQHRSETEMMRYLRKSSDKDIALDRSMIPLGSCTMKLNAATELTPISWPEFSNIHPMAPAGQCQGYLKMIAQLESWLCAITGYDAVSLQPNAGSQGEYAGLMAILRYHQSRGEFQRNICLIPSSAHGTNPASAQMCNLKVVVVQCDQQGNVDLTDLDEKIAANADKIAAIMITYPSTHGVFEEQVRQVCSRVHQAGGQVYIDGANLNALVGISQPGQFGGDVSHLNLHKTFCIPHGGGGPGVGPVAVKSHLAPFLPRDGRPNGRQGGLVSAAPFGSAGILPISWMYIRMMGSQGLRRATQVAILSANYLADRLSEKYSVLYSGRNGLVAHECILDTRPMSKLGQVSVDDIAKRLIDYGFHAPTMSFPVAGTLM